MRSKIARYGSQPSMTSGWAPIAQVPWPSSASPSVSSRPGSKVALASRAPIAGIRPIGLARISPSPRQASAQAIAHTSALVAALGTASARARAACGYRGLVPGLILVEVGGAELRPRRGIRRRAGVLALEILVPAVVRSARGEVRAVRRLDDADHHPALDPQRLQRRRGGQFGCRDDLLAGQVRPVGGHAEQVVEVRVRAEE